MVKPEKFIPKAIEKISKEIKDGKAINKENNDVTKQFQKGAEEALKIARLLDCTTAILKSNSPS